MPARHVHRPHRSATTIRALELVRQVNKVIPPRPKEPAYTGYPPTQPARRAASAAINEIQARLNGRVGWEAVILNRPNKQGGMNIAMLHGDGGTFVLQSDCLGNLRCGDRLVFVPDVILWSKKGEVSRHLSEGEAP